MPAGNRLTSEPGELPSPAWSREAGLRPVPGTNPLSYPFPTGRIKDRDEATAGPRS